MISPVSNSPINLIDPYIIMILPYKIFRKKYQISSPVKYIEPKLAWVRKSKSIRKEKRKSKVRIMPNQSILMPPIPSSNQKYNVLNKFNIISLCTLTTKAKKETFCLVTE